MVGLRDASQRGGADEHAERRAAGGLTHVPHARRANERVSPDFRSHWASNTAMLSMMTGIFVRAAIAYPRVTTFYFASGATTLLIAWTAIGTGIAERTLAKLAARLQ